MRSTQANKKKCILRQRSVEEDSEQILITSLQDTFDVICKADADCYAILPGSPSVAFELITPYDIAFRSSRVTAKTNLTQFCKKFKFTYAFYLMDGTLSVKYLLKLRAEMSNSYLMFPYFIPVQSEMAISHVLKSFKQIFEKESLKEADSHFAALSEQHIASRTLAELVLNTIPMYTSSCTKDINLLQDCYGSIRNIATVSKESILHRTPISEESAKLVTEFFDNSSSLKI